MKTRKYIYWLLALLCYLPAFTQSPVKIQRLEAGEKTCLHEGWFARNASEIGEDGNRLTGQPFEATGWMKAKVPGYTHPDGTCRIVAQITLRYPARHASL